MNDWCSSANKIDFVVGYLSLAFKAVICHSRDPGRTWTTFATLVSRLRGFLLEMRNVTVYRQQRSKLHHKHIQYQHDPTWEHRHEKPIHKCESWSLIKKPETVGLVSLVPTTSGRRFRGISSWLQCPTPAKPPGPRDSGLHPGGCWSSTRNRWGRGAAERILGFWRCSKMFQVTLGANMGQRAWHIAGISLNRDLWDWADGNL